MIIIKRCVYPYFFRGLRVNNKKRIMPRIMLPWYFEGTRVIINGEWKQVRTNYTKNGKNTGCYVPMRALNYGREYEIGISRSQQQKILEKILNGRKFKKNIRQSERTSYDREKILASMGVQRVRREMA